MNQFHLDQMEKKLTDAAVKGDVDELHNLTKDDPFLLFSTALRDGYILHRRPSWLREGVAASRPWAQSRWLEPSSHCFCQRRHRDWERCWNVCLAKGRETRIPLQSAVARGRTPGVVGMFRFHRARDCLSRDLLSSTCEI